MSVLPKFNTLWDRLAALEAKQREAEARETAMAEALLDYVRADLAAPWAASGKRLEKLLAERLQLNANNSTN